MSKPPARDASSLFSFEKKETILPAFSFLSMIGYIVTNFLLSEDLKKKYIPVIGRISIFACLLQTLWSIVHLTYYNGHPWIRGNWGRKLAGTLGYILAYSSIVFGIKLAYDNYATNSMFIPFILTFTNLVTQAIDIFNKRLAFDNYSNEFAIVNFVLGLVGCALSGYKISCNAYPMFILHLWSTLAIPLSFLGSRVSLIKMHFVSLKIMVVLNLGILLGYYFYAQNLSSVVVPFFKQIFADPVPLK